jgi:hypothetical protein
MKPQLGEGPALQLRHGGSAAANEFRRFAAASALTTMEIARSFYSPSFP